MPDYFSKVPRGPEKALDAKKDLLNQSLNAILAKVPYRTIEGNFRQTLEERLKQMQTSQPEAKQAREVISKRSDLLNGQKQGEEFAQYKDWKEGVNAAEKAMLEIRESLTGNLSSQIDQLVRDKIHALPKDFYYAAAYSPVVSKYTAATNENESVLASSQEKEKAIFLARRMIEVLDSLPHERGGDQDVNYILIFLCYISEFELALDVCDKCLAHYNEPIILSEKASILIYEKKYKEALQIINKIPIPDFSIRGGDRYHLGNARLYLIYGDLAFLSGQKQEALAFYQQASESTKKHQALEEDKKELSNKIVGGVKATEDEVMVNLRLLEFMEPSSASYAMLYSTKFELYAELEKLNAANSKHSPTEKYILTNKLLHFVKTCFDLEDYTLGLEILHKIDPQSLVEDGHNFQNIKSIKSSEDLMEAEKNNTSVSLAEYGSVNNVIVQIAKMVGYYYQGDRLKVLALAKLMPSCVHSAVFNRDILPSKRLGLFANLVTIEGLVKSIAHDNLSKEETDIKMNELKQIILNLFDGIKNLNSTIGFL